MDVIPHGLTDVPQAANPRRFVPAKPTDASAKAEPTPPAEPPQEPQGPHSALKFSVRAADVDARFEIHEGTKKVTVTMYDRETGEVLREFPSRHVLDAIASIMDRGFQVDTTS
jgi:hypothetical protein